MVKNHPHQILGALLTGQPAPSIPENEWPRLASTAIEQGVGPLLYRALSASPRSPGPGLQSSYYTTAAHNALFFTELARLLRAFQSAGIPAVLLKGAALALTHYPDPALRPMGDLDLLVPADRWQAAVDLAEAQGYRQETVLLPELARQLYHTALLLGGPGMRLALEIHANLVGGSADRRAVAPDWFWSEARPAAHPLLESAPALVLSPTAHLLYLAAHQGLHHPDLPRLIWLYDLHLVIAAGPVDWSALETQAGRLEWGGVLAGVLRQVEAVFHTPLPAGFLERLEPTGNAPTLDLSAPPRSETRLSATWRSLANFEPRARWRLVLALLCPSPAYMRWRYPFARGLGLALAYPYRWLDIAGDVLRTLARWCLKRLNHRFH